MALNITQTNPEPENNQVSPELAKVLQQLAAAVEPRFVRYEMNEKKSLFLINPAKDKTQIYYNDRLGRVLLGLELDAIKNHFSNRTIEIIDIPKEQSRATISNLGLDGFHANQPQPLQQDAWLKAGKEALKARANIAEVKEDNAERYTQQQQSPALSFFTQPKAPAKVAPVPPTTPSKKI